MEAIRLRLIEQQRDRGAFARVHPCPNSSAEVPDEMETRAVILSPDTPHIYKADDSPAMTAAKECLEKRGTGPRIYRNTLVFLAADKARLEELIQAVREHKAWKSIHEEREALNLDPFNQRLAAQKQRDSDSTVAARIPETYHWLLVPTQADPQAPVTWNTMRLQGQDALAVRAGVRLERDGDLLTQMAGTILGMQLDKIPLWRGNHVSGKQLMEDFAQYLYLPRLQRPELVISAIENGLESMAWQQDSFAYADAWDEEHERYKGLKAGQLCSVVADGQSVVVEASVATKQLTEEAQAAGAVGDAAPVNTGAGAGGDGSGSDLFGTSGDPNATGTSATSGGSGASGGRRTCAPHVFPARWCSTPSVSVAMPGRWPRR